MGWQRTTVKIGGIDRWVEIDTTVEDWDTDSKSTTCLARCEACDRCRFFLDGPRRGTCFYGGPYVGYVILQEPGWDGLTFS